MERGEGGERWGTSGSIRGVLLSDFVACVFFVFVLLLFCCLFRTNSLKQTCADIFRAIFSISITTPEFDNVTWTLNAFHSFVGLCLATGTRHLGNRSIYTNQNSRAKREIARLHLAVLERKRGKRGSTETQGQG